MIILKASRPFKPEFFQAFFHYCLSSVNNSCDELKNHNIKLIIIVVIESSFTRKYGFVK